MSTTTARYDAPGVPESVVTKTVSTTTGRAVYTAIVDLQGVEPDRTVTSEERTQGIVSLSPPTVTARNTNDLIRRAVVACGNAVYESPGLDLDGFKNTVLSYTVSFSILQGLRSLGEDV